jgi:hypothetical protein
LANRASSVFLHGLIFQDGSCSAKVVDSPRLAWQIVRVQCSGLEMNRAHPKLSTRLPWQIVRVQCSGCVGFYASTRLLWQTVRVQGWLVGFSDESCSPKVVDSLAFFLQDKEETLPPLPSDTDKPMTTTKFIAKRKECSEATQFYEVNKVDDGFSNLPTKKLRLPC